MKKLIYLTAAVLATIPVLLSSCAREQTESTRQAHEKMLAAHVKVIHHDTLQKTESGLYFTVVHKGSGKPTTDSSIVFVRETVLDLKYNIQASTDESVARQLGAYSQANAYIPLLWYMGSNSIMMGLEEMLLDMREGELRRIWLPYWLSAYQEGGSSENTTAMVYDLELVRVVSDIDKYQIDTLESFRDRFYPGVDSLERGFYKVTLIPGTGDSVQASTTAKAWYIGKFLNGHVFDTNVADTAQKYRIYNSGKDYLALQVSIPAKDQEEDTNQEEGSVVKGFSKCMQDMKYGEVAVCFFHSDYGYKLEGKQSSASGVYLGGGIPSYMPLFFWIYVPLNN